MLKNLDDYIVVFEKLIDKEKLLYLNNYVNEIEYVKHGYYDNFTGKTKTNDYDLDINKFSDSTDKTGTLKYIRKAIDDYINFLNLPFLKSLKNLSVVRFNRYTENTKMDLHWDSIYSMFDGKIKGVPVLSVLGCLNDNYEGGSLIFFENTKINLKAGDIMVFPSTFMYPHRVEAITKGVRYSFVSWAA